MSQLIANNMDYSILADAYEAISKSPGRLEKTRLTGDFLSKTPSGDLRAAVMLLQGRVFPEYDER